MRQRGRSGPDTSFHVFISYRRSDSGPYARNVYDALTQHFGAGNIFFDIDSIAPGRDFVDVLDETLTRADVLLVVMGPAWADVTDDGNDRRIDDPNDYVRLEVETALRSDDVRVIPVLVGGAKMPPANALPESLASLTRRNAASLVDEHWRSTMDELVAVLERIRDEPPRSVPRASTPSAGAASVPPERSTEPSARGAHGSADGTKPEKRRTRAIIGGIAALVVVAGVTAAVAISSGSSTSSSSRTQKGETVTSPKTARTPTAPTTSATESYNVGDCVTATGSGSSPPVACSELHTEEVTYVTPYPAGQADPWPGNDGFSGVAGPICAHAFTDYVGISPDQSQYTSTWLFPTEAEWASGSRTIYCAASSPAGLFTGSVKGTKN
jgi:hypothetical protein